MITKALDKEEITLLKTIYNDEFEGRRTMFTDEFKEMILDTLEARRYLMTRPADDGTWNATLTFTGMDALAKDRKLRRKPSAAVVVRRAIQL